MLKILFRIFLVLFVLIFAGIFGIYFYAGNIVKKTVETLVPEITRTSAHIDEINFSLLKGEVLLSGLALGNPTGFKTPESFSVKKINIYFQPKTLLQDKILINQVLIDGIHVTAEAQYQNKTITSNLTEIQKNVNSYIEKNTNNSSKSEKEEKAESTTNQKSKQVVIKDLQINNTVLTAGIMNQSVDIPILNIQKKNIGEEQDAQMTWQNTIVYILNTISSESVKESVKAVQQIIQKNATTLINTVSETASSTTDQTGSLINSIKEIF